MVLSDNLTLGFGHGRLLFFITEAAILLLLLEKNKVLLLQSIVFLLKLADLLLELLDLLDVLLIDLEQCLILLGLVISELSLTLIDLDNAFEEALILHDNRCSEVSVLQEVHVLHLGNHGLIFVALHVLQYRQVLDLLRVRQLGCVVAFIQLSQLAYYCHSGIVLCQIDHFGNSVVADRSSSLVHNRARLLELRVLFSLAGREHGIQNILLKPFFNISYYFQRRGDLINDHLVTVNGVVEAGLGASRRRVGLVILIFSLR